MTQNEIVKANLKYYMALNNLTQIGKLIGYHADTVERCLKEEGLL